MASISIEGGCTQTGATSWRYDYSNKDGFHSVAFTAPEGVRPKVGDSIEGSTLVVLTTIKDNQDHSRWYRHSPETWPNKGF